MNRLLAKLKRSGKPVQILVIVVAIAALYFFERFENRLSPITQTTAIEQAIASNLSDVQVEAGGTIIKVLSDDNVGNRHQRFLVKLDSGNVILIAHNIDLAPRVEDLRVGERISFFGEFDNNAKGGVVHWTHHDPVNKHPAGWLDYRGQKYN